MYSIIIPLYNEVAYIPALIESLWEYKNLGHQIIIVDDGSTDGSIELLRKSHFIDLIAIEKNIGKGFAIRKGIENAKNDKIIIYDGDLELNPKDISKLLFLKKEKGIKAIMGYRFRSLNPFNSSFEWGNFIFSTFFNIVFNSNQKDILCCAKAFYAADILNYKIESKGFDIDTELTFAILKANKNKHIYQTHLNYLRRNESQGKKLKISDGWTILNRMIKLIKHL